MVFIILKVAVRNNHLLVDCKNPREQSLIPRDPLLAISDGRNLQNGTLNKYYFCLCVYVYVSSECMLYVCWCLRSEEGARSPGAVGSSDMRFHPPPHTHSSPLTPMLWKGNTCSQPLSHLCDPLRLLLKCRLSLRPGVGLNTLYHYPLYEDAGVPRIRFDQARFQSSVSSMPEY